MRLRRRAHSLISFDWKPQAKNKLDNLRQKATVRPCMKSNLFCTCTLGLFLVCAIYTVWLSAIVFVSAKQFQKLQSQYASIQQTQEALHYLAADAVEYGKKHPAIEPILQQFELKPKPGATNAPAAAAPKAPAK